MDRIVIISFIFVVIIVTVTIAAAIASTQTTDKETTKPPTEGGSGSGGGGSGTATKLQSGVDIIGEKFTQMVDTVTNPIVEWSRLNPSKVFYNYDSTNDPTKTISEYLTNDPDTSIFVDKWKTDSDVLVQCADTLLNAIGAIYNNKYKESVTHLVLSCEYEFINHYARKIITFLVNGADSNPTSPPWGTEWRPFTVNMPNLITAYITKETNATQRNFAISLLDLIIKAPDKVMGYTLSLTDSASVAFPWLYLIYVKRGNIKEALENPIYQKILNYLKFKPVTGHSDIGLHVDFAYRTSDSRINYATFYQTLKESENLYRFDEQLGGIDASPMRRLETILLHPTVPFSQCGLFTDLIAPLGNCVFGIKVIPSAKYLRFFTDDCKFEVRGQINGMGPHPKQETIELRTTYQAVGEIGMVYTGDKYVPQAPTNCASVVFTDEAYGFLYQKYSLTTYTREEFIICDLALKQITVHIKLSAADKTKPCDMYVNYTTKASIDDNGILMAKIVFDVRKGGGVTASTENVEFPATLSHDAYTITPYNDAWVLTKNKIPIAAYRENNISEGGIVQIEGDYYTFMADNGQYMYQRERT